MILFMIETIFTLSRLEIQKEIPSHSSFKTVYCDIILIFIFVIATFTIFILFLDPKNVSNVGFKYNF